jgi:hypothetical protein
LRVAGHTPAQGNAAVTEPEKKAASTLAMYQLFFNY